jgi:hypothetical protein
LSTALSESIRLEGEKRKKVNKKLVARLKQKSPAHLDTLVHALHAEAFEEIDCLTCANCCKTTSPAIYETDIEKLARSLRIKPSEVIEKYLRKDEDGDWVMKTSPCPFLLEDNRCLVYEDRPRACRTYPHTDRKKVSQLLDLSFQNSFICPAVQQIFEGLEKKLHS